jgi:hypothetical protein
MRADSDEAVSEEEDRGESGQRCSLTAMRADSDEADSDEADSDEADSEEEDRGESGQG